MPIGKNTEKKGQVIFRENRTARPKCAQNRVKVGKPKKIYLTKQALTFSKKQDIVPLFLPLAKAIRRKSQNKNKKKKMKGHKGIGDGSWKAKR